MARDSMPGGGHTAFFNVLDGYGAVEPSILGEEKDIMSVL
jgi:hypothetical protein